MLSLRDVRYCLCALIIEHHDGTLDKRRRELVLANDQNVKGKLLGQVIFCDKSRREMIPTSDINMEGKWLPQVVPSPNKCDILRLLLLFTLSLVEGIERAEANLSWWV
uniref:Uncharacterized protein n=1 Tax=Solanum tuberosum TaxID=4113 RepID=M1E0H4_SOLTU